MHIDFLSKRVSLIGFGIQYYKIPGIPHSSGQHLPGASMRRFSDINSPIGLATQVIKLRELVLPVKYCVCAALA